MRTTHLPLLLLSLACCLLWVPGTEGGSLQHTAQYPAQRRTSYDEAANSYNRHEARTAETEKMKRFIARILNSDENYTKKVAGQSKRRLKTVQKKHGAVQEVDTRRLLDLLLKELATRGHHQKRQDVTTTTTTPPTTTPFSDEEEVTSPPGDQEENISDPTENGLNWQDGALDCTGGRKEAVTMRKDPGYFWNADTIVDCDKAKKEGSIVVPAEMTFTWHEGSLDLDEDERVGSFLIPTGVRFGQSEVHCDKGEEEIPLNLEDLDELTWLDTN